MRSATPKVLHDLCGRPMVDWPVAAAREAGADRVVVVQGPDRALDGRLPDGVETRRPADGRRHRRRRPRRARAPRRGHGPRRQRRRAAGHRRRPRAPSRRPRARPAPRRPRRRWCSTTRRGYGRVVRGRRRLASSASSRRSTRATRRPRSSRMREVNAGVYAFDAAALRGALDRLSHRQRPGRAVPPRRPAPAEPTTAGAVAAHVVDDPTLLLGVNDRVELARVRALAQAADRRGAQRAGVTDRRPRARPSSRSACALGAGHRRRAVDLPARHDRRGRALRARPADHGGLARRSATTCGPCTPTSRARSRSAPA